MGNETIDDLLSKMENLWGKLTLCRAFFPYTSLALEGAKGPLKAPYYEQYGHNVYLFSENGLTKDDINRMNDMAHHMNQNFIVRLCSLLESKNIMSKAVKIDKSLPGNKDLDILRRLRHVFAHSSGKYNPKDKKQKKLYNDLNAHYDPKPLDLEDFTLSIDTVLQPMLVNCRKYLEAKAKT